MSVLDLARADIRALQPYSSARMEARGGSVLLNANESPWPAVASAAGALNRYPDPQPAELIERLAALYGVTCNRCWPGAAVTRRSTCSCARSAAPGTMAS